MKKTLAAALLAGTILAGAMTSTHAFATVDTGIDPDTNIEYQTITGENAASVDTIGRLGQFDPETIDPEVPGLPEPGDSSWIKVQLPTAVAYYSTGESDHKKIASAKHEIKNLSQYPVAVSLVDFTGPGEAVDGEGEPTGELEEVNTELQKTLDFVAPLKTVNLITANEAAPIATAQKVMELGGYDNGTNKPQDNTGWASSGEFDFTGATDGTASLLTEQKEVNNKLHFSFQALNADGEIPTPAPGK